MKAKSLLIITLLMMFSFSSFAVTDAECKTRPLLRGNALIEQYVTGPYAGIDIGYYGVYNGCVYVGGINANSDGSQSMSWFPQYSFIPGESKPGKKPPIETEKPIETKPSNQESETVSDGEGTGTGTGTGTGSGSSSSTDSSTYVDPLDSEGSLSGNSSSGSSSFTYSYDEGTGTGTGSDSLFYDYGVYNTNPGQSDSSSDGSSDDSSDDSSYIISSPLTPPVNSSSSDSVLKNYSPPPNSVTMAGNIVSNTVQGGSNAEDNDGDGILNELRNFHHDFNASQGRAQKTDNKEVVDAINKNGKASVDNSDKNNQALIDTLNKNHQEVIESLNKDNQIDERSLNNAFDDGYSHYENGATSAIDGIINALDKYSPNLKGFGLPDGFYSGKGHCVPLDLSFNVDLSYFHYSAPVNLSTGKMCEFYDGYPRELLKLLIYILTAFVLFRLVKKALE